MEGAEITVNTPCKQYEYMQTRWQLIDTLMGGTLAMRQAGEKYLPMYPKETDTRYKIRRDNSVLLEQYKNTITQLSGKPFGEPVKISEDADDFFKQIAMDVDLTGKDLTVFAKECMTDLLLYGKCHIMTEYPNTTELQNMIGRELTLADEQELKLRPYLMRISPHNIINWSGSRISGTEVLTRLQMRHTIQKQDPNNLFGVINKPVVIVWEQQFISVWEDIAEEGEDEHWILRDENVFPNTLRKIPLTTVYANRKSLLTAEPPLEGLAHLNAKHWRNQSDQDNIEQVARVPMLFFRGFSKQDLGSVEIGPFKVFGNKDPQSDVQVIETNGSAVKVGSDSLRQLEEQMNAVGLAPMRRKSGNPTATELAIEAGREVSDLEVYTMLLEAGIKEAFKCAAAWANIDESQTPEILISEDSGYSIVNGSELEELREDYKLGVLDRRTYLQERKRRGLYHESIEVEDVIAGLETEATTFSIDE